MGSVKNASSARSVHAGNGSPGAILATALLQQWHPTRNGALRPAQVSAGSNRAIWWICPSGHAWAARPSNRVRGTGCPYCAGRRPTDRTSLQARFPDLARQWHPTRNGDLTPADVTEGSAHRAWWQCDAGHEWAAAVRTRTSKRGGCPFCLGRWATPSTSLAARCPDLAAQWHPTRNGLLRPEDVVAGSNRAVWWRCARGHQWRTAVQARTRPGGTGCPRCADRTHHRMSLIEVAPHLAKEWVDELNDGPGALVAAGCNRRVWWRCEQGHLWQARVQSRARNGQGCPFCSGRRASPERNLAVCAPALATQWHPHRNAALTPTQVTPGAARRVWWRCPRGHVWKCKVAQRTTHGTGCPTCAIRGRRRDA